MGLYSIPTSSSPASGTWTSTYSTGSGGSVIELNGVGYGELLNSQTGESLSINSITLQPYQSNIPNPIQEQVSQSLQPIVFRKRVASGNDKVYVLNPIVSMYQQNANIQNLTLGDKSDEFIFDGTTRLSYELLPFSTINIQFNYTKLTNFVFGYPNLLKSVYELNKARNEEAQYKSGIGREFIISPNLLKKLVQKKPTKK